MGASFLPALVLMLYSIPTDLESNTRASLIDSLSRWHFEPHLLPEEHLLACTSLLFEALFRVSGMEEATGISMGTFMPCGRHSQADNSPSPNYALYFPPTADLPARELLPQLHARPRRSPGDIFLPGVCSYGPSRDHTVRNRSLVDTTCEPWGYRLPRSPRAVHPIRSRHRP